MKNLFLLLFACAAAGALNVEMTVKECTGVAVSGYPISAVVPLPFGQYQNTNSFRVTDAAGATVPAQFNVLNRWWARDNSIRHLKIEFQPAVDAFTGAGTGKAVYYLKDDGTGSSTGTDLTVTETASDITVVTGPLKFIVSKAAFNILDQVWLDKDNSHTFDAAEQIIQSHAQNGGVFVPRAGAGGPQYDAGRADVTVTVEEAGPMRAVIRAEAVTVFTSTADHLHGFAVRIYAYAGKPYVKIDYQLQNSAKNVTFSWPLYFESLDLDFRLNMGSNPTVRVGKGDNTVFTQAAGTGLTLAQTSHNAFAVKSSTGGDLATGSVADGYLDVSDGTLGAAAMVRYCHQMWPNGVAVDGTGRLSLQLWPRWDTQWYYDGAGTKHDSLYWLWDMQHLYKETMLYFHDGSATAADLAGLARLLTHHPVAVLPLAWYQQTRATVLGYDGHAPAPARTGEESVRRPVYSGDAINPADPDYYMNMSNFGGIEFYRRQNSCAVCCWPANNTAFIVSGNPADYFRGDEHSMGEINHRPEWIARYAHDSDYTLLSLTENPYCGGTWRRFDGHGRPVLAADPLPGTLRDWAARDDAHGWHYHVEEAYYYTANPWIKDWMMFIKEFRKQSIRDMDPAGLGQQRAMGHMIDHTLQAFRVTGDMELPGLIADYIGDVLRPKYSRDYGQMGDENGFQTGYIMRALCDFAEEIRGYHPQGYADAFQLQAALCEWNYLYGNFPYFHDARTGVAASGGTGLTLVDPEAWFYWTTGHSKYLKHIQDYMSGSLGAAPYGDWTSWTGQYENRMWQYVKQTPRPDTTAPAAVGDLAVTADSGTMLLRLDFTAPADTDAAAYYVVWSDLPIAYETTLDLAKMNWWAAAAYAPADRPRPGQRQSIVMPIDSFPSSLYTGLYTFDAAGNMSPGSNMVQARPGQVVNRIQKAGGNGTGPGIMAYPNPFNPAVVIKIRGQKPETRGQKVEIKIYNTKGQIVENLASGFWPLASGITWNASGMPSGVYILQVRAGHTVLKKSVVLAK